MRKWMLLIMLALTACGTQNAATSAPAQPSPVTSSMVSAPTPTTTVPASTRVDQPSEFTNAAGEHVRGSPDAPVKFIDYSDFL